MVTSLNELKGYSFVALDGEIGKVKEFYFDDEHWTVRYLIVDTGSWLTDREVLISPHAVTDVHVEQKHIQVKLTQQQMEDSPTLDTDKPISKQFEKEYHSYFSYPMYWGGPYMWGNSFYPDPNTKEGDAPATQEKQWNAHLRSTHEVRGYHFESKEGSVGYVDDFIVDTETWAIRYLVLNTRNWLPGRKVLISPKWVEGVSWSDSTVSVQLSREAIKLSPEFSDISQLDREYETKLHHHYDRPGYWDETS